MYGNFLQGLQQKAPNVNLALHFRFIEKEDWLSDTTVSVRLLARVLWAVRPFIDQTGQLLIRMEKLFYTQELEVQRVTAWRDQALCCRRWPCIDPGTVGDLDRIWVVVLTGRLAGCAEEVCRRLQRAGRHPMLFGMIVSSEADQLQRLYLGLRVNCIGVLSPGDRVQLDFDAVAYHPSIERMLCLLRFDATVSTAAMRTMRGLTHLDQPPPHG